MYILEEQVQGMKEIREAGPEEEMLVSVILCAYNAEKTLDVAVSSILEQTHRNLELIICDDGSADGTWRVLQRLAEKDSRIRLIRNDKRSGPAQARNRCLALARGRFIALMDADDWSAPTRIARQVRALQQWEDFSFVGTKGDFFALEPGDRKDSYWFVPFPEKEDFLMTLPFVHASLMFHSEVLKAIGGYREDLGMQRQEDYELLMRAYAMGYRGMNLEEPLYCIRKDTDMFRKRRYRHRFAECAMKWQGFSRLGLMPRGIPYAVKPLLVGLIPVRLLEKMKTRYYCRKERPNK